MRSTVLLLAIACLGCQNGTGGPQVYRDTDEYLAALKHVQELTREPFNAVHDGQPISERETKDLKEALTTIDGLIAYKPDNYGPYVLKGLTLRALDRDGDAIRSFQQALLLVPKELKEDDKAAIARIHAEMASTYFDQQPPDLVQAEKEADTALSIMPDDPTIKVDVASIKIEAKKPAEAKKLLEEALKADPSDKRAKDLLKLIQMAGH
ncbi:MAG: tetratricopeptide repeat protein [Armatimonadetes bacterium]|nr:tetratricopeptide repeat protein [Armatimonadota bacterium]